MFDYRHKLRENDNVPSGRDAFRVYWAYNALRLNSSTTPPVPITRSMFPNGAAGDYTYSLSQSTLGPNYTLREPRKTFRFSVATTF